ncbi:hypothetical protein C8Q77DRAFT_345431 [Trametes polyzona]|nr:hypothetical protein C8Q77DRAFT_345431 [Trametes polyzona]
MNLVHAPTQAPHPLFARTNTPRFPKVHFKLPVLKKSAPTVSVTNTNAARTNSCNILAATPLTEVPVNPPSSVPFPSSPIPCPPPRKRSTSENSPCTGDAAPELLAFPEKDCDMDAEATNRQVSHTDILRRRSKSCLAASFFHHDAYLSRKSPAPSPKHAAAEQPAGPKRAASRRESMSAGTPSGKSTRKSKRVLADAQFLATLHSTLASLVRARTGADAATALDECAAQDALLVERIWHNLIDMGCKPVPLDAPPSPVAASEDPSEPPAIDLAREAAERAARRTMSASSTTPSVDRAQTLSVTPLPNGDLAVPQLVAVLTMRHRDRSSARPRSVASKRGARSTSRSPLSTTSFPASLSDALDPPLSG